MPGPDPAVNVVERSTLNVHIRVQFAEQARRIALRVPSGRRIVVPVVVVYPY